MPRTWLKSITNRPQPSPIPEKALAPGAPAVHPEWPDNMAFNFHQEGGDTAKAFREADLVVKQRITSQRLIPTAMETRGVVAEWRAGERSLTLHSSTQIPHLLRTLVAGILGMPENLLRVITPEVGGGFGSKLNVYAEEALMAFIAMQINKPVKWVESRRENFTATIHGRGHVDYFELAAKRDGTMLGLKLKLIQDLGAYHQLLTPVIPTLSVLMMPGLYRFKNVRRTWWACSRIACRPTRIAAPAVRRRRTASSGWWTCSRRN